MECAACRAADVVRRRIADAIVGPSAERSVCVHDERERRLAQRLRFFDRCACVQCRQRRRRGRAVRAAGEQTDLRAVAVRVRGECERRTVQVARHRSRAVEELVELAGGRRHGERTRCERDAESGRDRGCHDRDRDDDLDECEAAFPAPRSYRSQRRRCHARRLVIPAGERDGRPFLPPRRFSSRPIRRLPRKRRAGP